MTHLKVQRDAALHDKQGRHVLPFAKEKRWHNWLGDYALSGADVERYERDAPAWRERMKEHLDSHADNALELGPNSGPRLAASACPWCGVTGSLMIYGADIPVEAMAGRTVVREAPVMECRDCLSQVAGRYTVEGVEFERADIDDTGVV